MGKTYSKKELEAKAQETFKQYSNATEVFATVDGNVFLQKNRAELHAGKKGKVYSFEKEVAPTDTDNPITAKAAIEIITNAVTKEELEALGLENDDRKTVKEAYAKKLEELTETKTDND